MYACHIECAPPAFLKRFGAEIAETPGASPSVFGRAHGRFFRLSYGDAAIVHQVRSGVALWGLISARKKSVYAVSVFGLTRPVLLLLLSGLAALVSGLLCRSW